MTRQSGLARWRQPFALRRPGGVLAMGMVNEVEAMFGSAHVEDGGVEHGEALQKFELAAYSAIRLLLLLLLLLLCN